MENLPKHIAIIMDGNGRWANARGLPRTAGHKEGVEACRRTVKAAQELGIKYLTLFAFSTENWSRPAKEVNELMRLLRMFLRSEIADMHASNVRLKVIGSRAELSNDIVKLIEHAENLTAENTGATLSIALNYSGRQDIIAAAAAMAKHFAEQDIEATYDNAEEFLPSFFSTAGMPDPDMIIRTSGEQRMSNFLLWQGAYSELIFTNTLWPDFDQSALEAAIEEFQGRDRRFGKVSSVK